MTALEKIREWIKTYPGCSQLRDLSVDYTDEVPANGGVNPSGLLEVSRKRDILGNVTVLNQYSFTLYFVFAKAPGDDVGAEENAQWLMDFQDWVQSQSITGKAPVFGDAPRQETIKAQNGSLFTADSEGTAVYSAQLSVQFIKRYEVN
jgi:hypothetical protein|nr:MAG TPA: Minor capsid protein from bacteriophage [Caudoviricetes sp.]